MRRKFAISLLALVVLSAVWLVIAGVSLGRDFATLNRAPEGTTMRMHQGVIEVASTSDSGTIVQMVEPINLAHIIPAIATPFLVIFGAALMGCRLLVQIKRNAG